MLDLSAPGALAWRPPIVSTVAAKGEGVDELWGEIRRHQEHLAAAGELARVRRDRLEREFRAVLAARIERDVDRLLGHGQLAGVLEDVIEHRVDPYEAADRLLSGLRSGESRA
jgi:LAO/AO transport system kinase